MDGVVHRISKYGLHTLRLPASADTTGWVMAIKEQYCATIINVFRLGDKGIIIAWKGVNYVDDNQQRNSG